MNSYFKQERNKFAIARVIHPAVDRRANAETRWTSRELTPASCPLTGAEEEEEEEEEEAEEEEETPQQEI